MKKNHPTKSNDVNTLLRNEIAHLWPAITTINSLQKECSAVLPQLFLYGQVLQLDGGKLVLAVPSAAFASKLKQQLPQLQLALQKNGWQIDSIRIKVQTNQTTHVEPNKQLRQFPDSAFQAFVTLEKNLAGSKHNDDLLGALRTLLERHK